MNDKFDLIDEIDKLDVDKLKYMLYNSIIKLSDIWDYEIKTLFHEFLNLYDKNYILKIEIEKLTSDEKLKLIEELLYSHQENDYNSIQILKPLESYFNYYLNKIKK